MQSKKKHRINNNNRLDEEVYLYFSGAYDFRWDDYLLGWDDLEDYNYMQWLAGNDPERFSYENELCKDIGIDYNEWIGDVNE